MNDPAGLNLNIGFGEWMMFMFPLAVALLIFAWFVLLKMFPFTQKKIELNIEGESKKDWRSIVVYITFAVTILLWVGDKITSVHIITKCKKECRKQKKTLAAARRVGRNPRHIAERRLTWG